VVETAPADITRDEVEALRRRARGDLYFFAKGILGYDRFVPHVHKPLCRLLELYAGYTEDLVRPWPEYEVVLKEAFRRAEFPEHDGDGVDLWTPRIAEIRRVGIRKLMILMPRGWYKTTLISIAYPAWRGVRDTNVRVLLAQNTAKNATSKGSALGEAIVKSAALKLLFPEILPGGKEKWSEDGRCLARSRPAAESTYEFAGTKTQVVSRHFNLVIEDDTVAPDKDDLGEDCILPSKEDVAQAIGWHKLVPPLLDEIINDQNIVTGTRWYVKDLLSTVMETEKEFVVYRYAVREGADGLPDPKGRFVWPERFNETVLRGVAASMGPYLYSCLYMNTPVQSGAMTFQPDWIRYYDVEPPRLVTFTTVDPAGDPADSKGEVDYNVVMTCGKDMADGKIYVLDYARERCSPSRLLELIWEHVKKWHPVTVGIESVAYQKTLLHWNRQWQVSRGEFFHVTQITSSRKSKNAKIQGLQPGFANGIIRLRPHMKALVNELLVFPLGTNDDLADALAMQLELWRITPAASEMEPVEALGDVNSFEWVLREARAEQGRVAAETASVRRAPAWGSSMPKLVFDASLGEEARMRYGISRERISMPLGRAW
jgi:predicted phage terminase large subunit-like protein